MPDRVYNVLFLCTGNSARSILAEAMLNKEGQGRFRAFSAGSQPKADVNPLAVQVLRETEYPTEGLRSKSWDEFARPDAPVMDFVFTVCDTAAGEGCPYWPGQPVTAHWGIEDPASVEGTDLERKTAFVTAQRFLKNRISTFVALPLASLDGVALSAKVREIGQQAGATSPPPGGRVMDVVIYHNPDCGTSRNTLALIRNAGIEPHVVEYLKTPPNRILVRQLAERAGVSIRDLLREKGTPYSELGLADESLTDDQLLDAIAEHPILLNRPLVVSPKGVTLCRPSEVVLDLLPAQQSEFVKEDGERVVDEHGRRVATA